MTAEQNGQRCGRPEEPRDSCTLAPGKSLHPKSFDQVKDEQVKDLTQKAAPSNAITVIAGERCAHCGDQTPLGGTCPDCGWKICTRSMRVRNMALENRINLHWACPVVRKRVEAS